MEHPLRARLLNAEGELIAEGPCWLDEPAGRATLEPDREPGYLQKERGDLALELDTGRSLMVSDKPMIHRLRPPSRGAGPYRRRTRYRLRLINNAQEATAAGAAGEGAPALPRASLRLDGETPAAP